MAAAATPEYGALWNHGTPAGWSAGEWYTFREQGYLVCGGFLSGREVATLAAGLEVLLLREGEDAGSEQPSTRRGVRRLCNLFAKGEAFLNLAMESRLVAAAHAVIGPGFRWQAFNFHDPLPGQSCRQAIHADRQFFPGCRAYLNVLILVDGLTAENGATRVVPGSHRRAWPSLEIPAAEARLASLPGEVRLIAPAGTVVLVHGDTWHGACENRSTGTRRVLHLGYACEATAPQYAIGPALSADVRHRWGDTLRLRIPDLPDAGGPSPAQQEACAARRGNL